IIAALEQCNLEMYIHGRSLASITPSMSHKILLMATRYCGPEKERHQKNLQSIQQFEVEVTLDPDTAHPALILSADGKRVHDGDVRQNLPNNPEGFHKCVNVLGKQGFTRGKFYFQVQVKGKTAWALGVARESVKRKGNVSTNPKTGYWTIMLTDEDEYQANEDDQVCLSLKSQPEKVGVFVDYEEGLVSFYNSDTAEHLYSFTGFCFTENLLPYFSPCTNDSGKNSAPLIICPVNRTEVTNMLI
uniref:B30.2/SPRY domain-containing protein n=1 Tax=Amphilophus citrinellus TaxID=61819 RepID=A0A3Q0S116_AMPCI